MTPQQWYKLINSRVFFWVKEQRLHGLLTAAEYIRRPAEEHPLLRKHWARKSATVRKLALRHVDALDRKIGELRAMRKAVSDLIRRCHGDSRPDCPIIEDLEDRPRRSA